MKLAVIVLDGMDIEFLRAIESIKIVEHYNEKGDTLTISDYPHTQSTAIHIYSGIAYSRPFWLKPKDGVSEPSQPTQAAAVLDNILEGRNTNNDNFTLQTRSDFNWKFIWDYLKDRAEAVQIPIVLPPYDYNAHKTTEYWFPDLSERQYHCTRDLATASLEGIDRLANDEIDFFTCWLPSYDKLLHSISPSLRYIDEKFLKQECDFLDEFVDKLIHKCEENNIHYIIMGDHGAPSPAPGGGLALTETNFMLRIHRKHSIMISDFKNQPKYTDEIFDFMCEKLGIEERVKIGKAIPQIRVK